MKVTINDKPTELPRGATLTDALAAAGITAKAIATALNGEVVPAAKRSQTVLSDNDTILVIKAFYGG